MNSTAADVMSVLSRLAGAVVPVRSEWVGPAQIQFDALWGRLQDDANGIQAVLNGMAELTDRASTVYDGTEKSIARTFEEFRSELDRLSELLVHVRRHLPASPLDSGTVDDDRKAGTDADLIDKVLTEGDAGDEADGPVVAAPETSPPPWARFMTPAAWRGIE